MDAKKKKRIIIYTSVGLILGVGGYFLYKWLKDSGKIGKKEDEEDKEVETQVVYVNQGGTGGSSSSSSSSDRPSDIKAFQKWVIEVKKDTTILGGGGDSGFGDDGKWGSKTKSAWAKYKDEYNKYVSGGAGTTSPTDTSVIPGMLRNLYTTLQSGGRKPQFYEVNYKGQGNQNAMIQVNSTGVPGQSYIWFDNGTFKVVKNGTTLSSGTFSNDGKTLVPSTGPWKNKTMKVGNSVTANRKDYGTKYSSDVVNLANLTTFDPTGNVTLSNDLLNAMVNQIVYATKGAATYDDILWQQLRNVQTRGDFDKLMNKSKDGYTIKKWIIDDMNEVVDKKAWNSFCNQFRNIQGERVASSYFFSAFPWCDPPYWLKESNYLGYEIKC